MFEDATFHSRGILPTQTPKWMLATLAFNLTILAALIAIPLLYPGSLPGTAIRSVLSAPAPVRATPPQTVQATPAQTTTRYNPYTVPTHIPIIIKTDPDAPPPTQDISPLNAIPEGTTGATGNTASLFHNTPPAVVASSQPQKVRVSNGVTQGLLYYSTTPAYPIIARTARVSGTVVLAATISTTGTIENLRVISGHPMLRQAAIDSVQNWRYHPYRLNNQPVEVETTINVVFSLGTN